MTYLHIPLNLKSLTKHSPDREVLQEAENCRQTVRDLMKEERYLDAFERSVEIMRLMRSFSDYENVEFRALLVGVLYDIAELHYAIKDYRQSERELETLFKVLEALLAVDQERFAPFHILAMELSTRILRSRKKAMEMLVRQQTLTNQLYERVNSGMVAATDRLVDSLCKTARLVASSGDYKSALKFYAEAIKFSKKRTGKVTRKEVKMTIEMAEVMMRIRSMRPRAARLLSAILPHAIALETIELEEDILALLEVLSHDDERESRWKALMTRIMPRKKVALKGLEDTPAPSEKPAPAKKKSAPAKETAAKEKSAPAEKNTKK